MSDEEVEEGDEDGDDQQQLLNGGHAGLSKEEQDRLRAEEEEEERKRFGWTESVKKSAYSQVLATLRVCGQVHCLPFQRQTAHRHGQTTA